MIPVSAYWKHGLEALTDLLQIDDAQAGGSFTACFTVELSDYDAGSEALRAFHSRRWPNGPGEATMRRSDLGELLVALDGIRRTSFAPNEAYPRCLSAMGRGVREPGIDVMSFRLMDRGTSALEDDEYMT
jgi:hypothetical protein